MKKLKLNITLNHKQSDYQTREMIVEKVITLYGKSFSELKNHPSRLLLPSAFAYTSVVFMLSCPRKSRIYIMATPA